MAAARDGLEAELGDGRVEMRALLGQKTPGQHLHACLRVLPAVFAVGDAHAELAGRVLLNGRVDVELLLLHVSKH